MKQSLDRQHVESSRTNEVERGRFADNISPHKESKRQHVQPVSTEGDSTVQRKAGLKAENATLTLSNFEGHGVTDNPKMGPMIGDQVKRVFENAGEINSYNAGTTDHIGVVKDKWVRMDPAKFYILGEQHKNPNGTVPDVIKGIKTKRFMYEPFHDIVGFEDRGGIVETWDFGGTNQELSDLTKQDPLGSEAGELSPSLENMVFKIGVGFYFVKQFAKTPPLLLDQWQYDSQKTYSISDRGAHYLKFAILICKDLLSWEVAENSAADKWRKCYLKDRAIFDQMVVRRGDNDRIWLYEMAPNHTSQTLQAIWNFCDLGYDWVTTYVKLLAAKNKDRDLAEVGGRMQGQKDVKPLGDHPLNQARELYMIKKLQAGKGTYLIAGMGNAHRNNLESSHGNLADEWDEVTAYMGKSNRKAASDYDSLD